MKYDSSLRGENEKIVGKVVRSADDVIKNVCEGEGGLIDFIITGYLGMDVYSSKILDNRERVNGFYVSERLWWLKGWYYGGYWMNMRFNYNYNTYLSSYYPYKGHSGYSWFEDSNWY